jgi:hypothetical protein
MGRDHKGAPVREGHSQSFMPAAPSSQEPEEEDYDACIRYSVRIRSVSPSSVSKLLNRVRISRRPSCMWTR